MIVLDTDHLTVLGYPASGRAISLRERLRARGSEEAAATVISVAEHFRGALAEINRQRDSRRQLLAYERLLILLRFYKAWRVVPFDESAQARYDQLRRDRIRVGTSDLKIAAIALTHDALLLTANTRDFEKVPGLRFDNWLI